LKQLRRPWRGRLLLILTAILAIGVIAAACGGDDDDDVEPLKIGFLNVFSGPLAEFGPAIQTGVELAIAHINAAGGVNGSDVTFVTGDSAVDPIQGVEEARRLVEVEGVAAIVGPLSSGVAIAVAESVTGAAGVVTITPSGTSPAISAADDDDFLFRSTVSDAAQGPVFANLANEEGYDNLGILYIDDAYGQGLSAAIEAAFGGESVSVAYQDGQASYLAELQEAAANGATVLVSVGFPTQAEIYIREALENDLFDKFLFVDGTKSQDLIDAIGADFLNGFKGTAPGAGPDSPSTIAWNEAYIAEYGELPALPFVREAYDATIAIALAAEAAGSSDREAIRDALRDISSPGGVVVVPGAEGIAAGLQAIRDGDDVNYEGAATTLDWDAVGDVTTGFIEVWEYQDGAPVAIEEFAFDLG
jgi:ABC-type branched-subunit amino acid transport system substrate-binding protein